MVCLEKRNEQQENSKVVFDTNELCFGIISELGKPMDYKFISEIKDIRERSVQFLKCLIDMIQGLIFLHQKSIIHKDIKPDNLVLTGENKVKWIDFGIAKGLNEYTGTVTGTVCFAAPEISMIYGQKADVYSFGGTAICLWKGIKVFQEGDTFNSPIKHFQKFKNFLSLAQMMIL